MRLRPQLLFIIAARLWTLMAGGLEHCCPCSGLSSVGQFSRFLEKVDVVSNCCCCSCFFFFEGGRWEGRQCLRSNFPRNFVIFTTKSNSLPKTVPWCKFDTAPIQSHSQQPQNGQLSSSTMLCTLSVAS